METGPLPLGGGRGGGNDIWTGGKGAQSLNKKLCLSYPLGTAVPYCKFCSPSMKRKWKRNDNNGEKVGEIRRREGKNYEKRRERGVDGVIGQ